MKRPPCATSIRDRVQWSVILADASGTRNLLAPLCSQVLWRRFFLRFNSRILLHRSLVAMAIHFGSIVRTLIGRHHHVGHVEWGLMPPVSNVAMRIAPSAMSSTSMFQSRRWSIAMPWCRSRVFVLTQWPTLLRQTPHFLSSFAIDPEIRIKEKPWMPI